MSSVPAVPLIDIGGSRSIFQADWERFVETEFDRCLKSAWNLKVNEGHFRYRLTIRSSKFLCGDLRFLAQLNTDRATNRRPPEELDNVKQPFCPNSFNFTRVGHEEFVFRIRENCGSNSTESDDTLDTSYIVINVSPLEIGHSLLLPSLFLGLPQILTLKSLKLAVDILLTSGSPAFRVGFNGLCAYATVNHLHFHVYYLNCQMLLEYLDVEHLSGRCYQLPSTYPGRGYVFQIRSNDEIDPVLRDVATLTDYFIENNIAHNLYFSRGTSFGNSSSTSPRDCVRIFLWPRTSSTGAKILDEFNPATCELFGHLVVKSEEAYEHLTEEYVATTLRDITEGPFLQTRDYALHIFESEIVQK